ncbi:MFS transporter [Legionella sp. W05-934-2]|uniref:MFS transporter n=1 Tax=Legionella sp. W05-934-2 TaxID=1198649 RepID=UPI00346207B0
MVQTQSWFKTIIPIATIFASRMLGLFMLIPIFTLYANKLSGATPILVGIAFGAYGLSQGLLQIPFGLLSDKFGRKPLIAVGLVLFIIGSLIGACSDTIYSMILARLMQGMGAIGSVLIALTADLTKDNDRTKAMAVIGLTIGVSFSLAMVISPAISHAFGLAGIFYLTAIFGFIGLAILYLVIPTPVQQRFHLDSETNATLIAVVIKNRQLLALDFGIFFQHLILTATFFALPLILKNELAMSLADKSLYFYLPIMISAFVLMVPFIVLAEKYQRMPMVFIGAIVVIALSQLCLSFEYQNFHLLTACVLIYFVAFNVLEALLPSLISRKAPIHSKGTAMGVYSTSQFLGIFVGGALAGFLFRYFSFTGIYLVNTVLTIIWFLISTRIDLATNLTSVMISCELDVINDSIKAKLQSFPGVQEMVFSKEEDAIYLKVNQNQFDLESFKAIIA